MKKILMLVFVTVLMAKISFAGELRTTPEYVVLTEPTTNQTELMTTTFYHGSNPYAKIKYHILDSNGSVRKIHTVTIRNVTDNPDTDPLLCIGIGDPWTGCTGVGTGDLDETDTSFTDYVNGFGNTMKTRGDTKVWQHIQSMYTTQASP